MLSLRLEVLLQYTTGKKIRRYTIQMGPNNIYINKNWSAKRAQCTYYNRACKWHRTKIQSYLIRKYLFRLTRFLLVGFVNSEIWVDMSHISELITPNLCTVWKGWFPVKIFISLENNMFLWVLSTQVLGIQSYPSFRVVASQGQRAQFAQLFNS